MGALGTDFIRGMENCSIFIQIFLGVDGGRGGASVARAPVILQLVHVDWLLLQQGPATISTVSTISTITSADGNN